MSERPHRRWLRFSLRTMFVVVTALCCWLGWESSVVRERQAVRSELKQNAAFQFVSAEEFTRRYPPGSQLPTKLAAVPLVRRWLGDEAIQEIWFVPHFQAYSEPERSRLARVFPEAEFREALQEPCHPGCFPRGTLIDTPQGQRPIESIRTGDSVTAFLKTGESVNARVQSVFTTENRLWRVETEAGDLLTTETQPLCSASDRTLTAGELQPGDSILYRQDGRTRSVRVLAVASTARTEKVFNLVLGDGEIFVAGGFLARSKPPVVSRRLSLQ